MIVVQNRVPVAAGHEDAFIERFRARRGLVDDQPGFIRNMVLTFWESEEHFRAWTESDAFKEAHRRVPPREMFRGHSELEIHRVELDTPST
jgi:heme-degrading monooxygenase HmoA